MVKGKKISEIMKKPEADVITNYLIERKNHGLYSLVLVSGTPGSGKTSTCMRIAEKVTKEYTGEETFNVDNVIDNFLDLVGFVRKADPNKLCIAVVEEVSVLFSSRRSMASENVDVAKVLDTCRKRQVILLANAPIWTAIDSHMRALGNVYIETLKIYKTSGIVVSKFFRLQTNPRTGKTYTHTFRRNGTRVRKMYTTKPNREEWDKYEGKKDKFMDELYLKMEAKAQKKKEKELKLLNPVNISLETLSPQYKDVFYKKFIEKKKTGEIGKEMGVTDGRISQILGDIRKIQQKTKENPEFLIKKQISNPIK